MMIAAMAAMFTLSVSAGVNQEPQTSKGSCCKSEKKEQCDKKDKKACCKTEKKDKKACCKAEKKAKKAAKKAKKAA